MDGWRVSWNFDKESYSPGESASISIWLENNSNFPLHVSEVAIAFDFGVYYLNQIVGGSIQPMNANFLGSSSLCVPDSIVGRKIFNITYRAHWFINNNWVDQGYFTTKPFFISVYPRPYYNVFLSRGIHIEDRVVGDPIANMIREWGFYTTTVGIEVLVPNEEVPSRIRHEIQNSDALIVIATRRSYDILTYTWKSLDFIHNEVGVAYGIDKPMFILRDRNVSLGGLPSYLVNLGQSIEVQFDPADLNEVRLSLSLVMPNFRTSIESHSTEKFRNDLRNLILYGLAGVGIVTLAGAVGSFFQKR
jgi:hypothetical protein